MEVQPGVRVVRGRDWDYGDQDGGEGYVGTVVDGVSGGRVTVQWDVDVRAKYRCGEGDKYDLRVLDTGPTGIVHELVCSSCGATPLFGMVWQCIRCYQYYCCTPCYLANKHSLFHHFKRIHGKDRNQTVVVGPRILSEQVEAKGIFSGAKVIRGHDWKWKNQDGGEGSRGIVVAVSGMKGECARCVAEVKWPDKKKHLSYRLGRKGKVDLKLIPSGEAPGGKYCPSHLPELGGPIESSDDMMELVAGDKIRVNLEQDVWRLMQESCGEWNDSMAMFIGQTGLVIYADGGRSVLVSYNNSIFYNINVAAVTKVNDLVFEMGDIVRILEDNTEVSRMQKGHGEWNEDMAKCLGQLGTVVGILPVGDLRVLVQGRRYIFNQACVKHAQPGETPPPAASDEPDPQVRMQLMALEQVMSADLIPLAAAAGDAVMLTKALAKNNANVNAMNGGKTALHVAVAEGFTHIVELLLKHSPDLEAKESNNGDTPLLVAVHMDQAPCAKLLIEAGANINARSKSGDFPLYIATVKGAHEILKLLVKLPGIELDGQNKDGNTPLHAATYSHRRISASILLEAGADPTLYNNNCFSPILSAAKHGFYPGMEQFLKKHPQHVDTRKVDDGHTSLMIAAVNNYLDIVYLLASMESCDLNAVNEIASHTALHLAAQKGNSRIVEMLVGFGASLNKHDGERILPIHRAYLASDITPFDEFTPQLKKVEKRLLEFSQKQSIPPNVTLCCFLVCNGANLEFLEILEDHVPSKEELKSDMELMQIVADSEEALKQQDPSYVRFWGSHLRYPSDGGPPRPGRESTASSEDGSDLLQSLRQMIDRLPEHLKEGMVPPHMYEGLEEGTLSSGGAMVSGGELPEEVRSALAADNDRDGNVGSGRSGVFELGFNEPQPDNDNTAARPSHDNAARPSRQFMGDAVPNNDASASGPRPLLSGDSGSVPNNDFVTMSSRPQGSEGGQPDNEVVGVPVATTATTSTTPMESWSTTATGESSTKPRNTPYTSAGGDAAALSTTTTPSATGSTVETSTISITSSEVLNTQGRRMREEDDGPRYNDLSAPPTASGSQGSRNDLSKSDDECPPEEGDEYNPNLCCLCDNLINVEFHPCGCKAMCSECYHPRVKKCPTCAKLIQYMTTFNPHK